MKKIHTVLAILILLALSACGGGSFIKEMTAESGDSATDVKKNNNNPVDNSSQSNATASLPVGVDEPDFAEYAFYYLKQNRSKYGLQDPYSQLIVTNENIDNQKRKHVNFQQVYKGVPVWGSEIIVHLDSANKVYSVSGEILKGIGIANIQPGLTKEKATELVTQDKQWSEKGWQVEDAKLYIVNQDSKYNLVYRFSMGDGFPRQFVFMNAQNGKLIHGITEPRTKN